MLTHYNLVANILQTAGALALREDDIMLGVLPFFHIYGMTVIMNFALHVGATVVTMPRFDLEQCLQIRKVPRHVCQRGPSDRAGACEESARRQVRAAAPAMSFQAPHR